MVCEYAVLRESFFVNAFLSWPSVSVVLGNCWKEILCLASKGVETDSDYEQVLLFVGHQLH